MERAKFIADADLNQEIVDGLRRRQPSIDFLDAHVSGVRGLSDPEVLRIAAASGRVLVSHDRNTMIRHFKEFIAANDSPGLLILKQRISIGEAIDQIHETWLGSDTLGWRNQLRFGRASGDD